MRTVSALAILIVGVLLVRPVPARAADEVAGLEFVEPSTLSLSSDSSGGQTEAVSVWIRNSTTSALTPRLQARVEDTDANPDDKLKVTQADGSPVPAIPAGDVALARIVVTGITSSTNVSGQLVARADGAAPGSVGLTISPKPDFQHRASWILLVTFGIGALLVATAWAVGDSAGLSARLTDHDLDFTDGFASTLTLIAALLATVVSAGVLPDDTVWLSKGTYVALNIIFGALIAGGTLVFGAFQTKEGDGMHGYVWSFVIAAALTAWAAFGEIVTLWYLIWDINQTDGFGDGGAIVFEVIVVVGGLAMVLYLFRRVQQITAGSQEDSPPSERRRASRRARPLGLL
jgi:hypothetical protein